MLRAPLGVNLRYNCNGDAPDLILSAAKDIIMTENGTIPENPRGRHFISCRERVNYPSKSRDSRMGVTAFGDTW